MKLLNGTISKDYAWEIALFHKLREFSDGMTFFNMTTDWDRYLADHSPRFCVHVVILNYTLIEANIYYRHHRDSEDEKGHPS